MKLKINININSKPSTVRSILLQIITEAGYNKTEIDELITKAILFTTAPAARREMLRPNQEIEQRWYNSIKQGNPDFDVYNTPWYIAECFACWKVYSRKYLRNCEVSGVFDIITTVNNVLDLGCGVGITTATLADRFPNAEIIGTNILFSMQYNIAKIFGQHFNFKVMEDIPEKRVDIVFASEFFEHLKVPTFYLQYILMKADPKILIVANTFGSPAIGHFPTYLTHEGPTQSGRETARDFTSMLRYYGYKNLDCHFWNNRPQVWSKF